MLNMYYIQLRHPIIHNIGDFLSINYGVMVRMWHPEICDVRKQLIFLRYSRGTGTDPVLIQKKLRVRYMYEHTKQLIKNYWIRMQFHELSCKIFAQNI
jgi:hypothetical protein